jgi:PII-like signaling protein
MIPHEARLLRFYSNANDKLAGTPVYRAVVESARRHGLAGASVFPVELGYGAHRVLHDITSEYSSFDIPIVVEIVDAPEPVGVLLRELETMVREGLVGVTSTRVLHYVRATERPRAQGPSVATDPPQRAGRATETEGTTSMKIEGEGKRVTVYVGGADTWNGSNLAVAIVETCRAMGMAGATLSRGVMGFGKQSVVHKAHFLGLSDDLPEKIEVIDRPEEIERLLPVLDEMLGGGLIVVEDVHIVRYVHAPKNVEGRT